MLTGSYFMTLKIKLIMAVAVVLILLAFIAGSLSGQSVESVKTMMGLNPLAEQDLVPLPGSPELVQNIGREEVDQVPEVLEVESDENNVQEAEQVTKFVLRMIDQDAEDAEPINLDADTWIH